MNHFSVCTENPLSMTKPQIEKLKKHFAAVTACREWNLPAGYFPQLRPPGPKRLNKLQKIFIHEASAETYEYMREAFMESMSKVWGWPPGKYGKTIEAHGVELNDIAVMNIAQCPAPTDSYKSKQLQRCWNKWGYQQLEILQPSLIVAQGKQAYNFLMETGLPSQIQVVEGMHHADRRSRKRKDQLLEYDRRQIEANE